MKKPSRRKAAAAAHAHRGATRKPEHRFLFIGLPSHESHHIVAVVELLRKARAQGLTKLGVECTPELLNWPLNRVVSEQVSKIADEARRMGFELVALDDMALKDKVESALMAKICPVEEIEEHVKHYSDERDTYFEGPPSGAAAPEVMQMWLAYQRKIAIGGEALRLKKTLSPKNIGVNFRLENRRRENYMLRRMKEERPELVVVGDEHASNFLKRVKNSERFSPD